MALRKSHIILAFFFLSAWVLAQEKTTFTSEVSKSEAAVGERILLRFTVSTDQNSANGIRQIDFPDFKDLNLIGESEGTNIQISGTQMIKQYYHDIYFTIEKEGEYKIGKAFVEIDGKRYSTQEIKLKIIPSNQERQRDHKREANRMRGAFLKTNISNDNPYQNEEVILTVKLYVRDYSLLNRSHSFKEPLFEGTVAKKIDNSNSDPIRHENVNGKTFVSYELGKYILLPRDEGELEINSFSIKMQLDSYYGTETIDLVSEPILLNVKPLPEGKPKNFSEAVGDFSLAYNLNKEELTTEDVLNLELEIIGSGNLNTLQMPKVSFPKFFEIYPPKRRDAYYFMNNGIQGKRIEEFVLVPQYGGNYEIAPIEFSFFNPEEGAYKTVTTDTIKIKVKGNPPPKIEEKQEETDSLKPEGDEIFKGQTTSEEDESASVYETSIDRISKLNEKLKKSTSTFGWILWGLGGILLLGLIWFILGKKKTNKKPQEELPMSKKQFAKQMKSELAELKRLSKEASENEFREKQENVLTETALFLGDLNLSNFSDSEFISKQKNNFPESLLSKWQELFLECRRAKYAQQAFDADLKQKYKETQEVILQLLS